MTKYLLNILLISIVSTSYSQDFEQGYYVDYSNTEHHGLIRIKKKDGGFRFKESKNSESDRISTKDAKYFKMGERKFYVKSFNSTLESWENFSDLLKGELVVEKTGYFVELIESGKIKAYVHSDLEFNSLVPNRDREYYLEKGNLVKKMYSNEYINLPSKIQSTLKNFVVDDEVYLEKLQAKVYKDNDWFTLIRDYNNKYQDLPSKKDTVVIYRTKKKQVEEPVIISINGQGSWELYPNNLVKIEVNDITDFQICTDDTNCINLSGSLIKENYFEASFSSGDSTPLVNYADTDVGAYNSTRIEYLMKKTRRKSSK